MKLLRALCAALAMLAAAPAFAQTNSDYVPSGGPISAPAAGGQIGTSGWYDQSGGNWSVNGSNQLIDSGTGGNPWQTGVLARAASEASTASQPLKVRFVANGQQFSLLAGQRYTGSPSTQNYYLLNLNSGGTGQAPVFSAYKVIGGGASVMSQNTGTAPSSPLSSGTTYCYSASAVQTNSTTTTLTATLYAADCSTSLGTATFLDSTASLQNLSGRPSLAATGIAPPITELIVASASGSAFTAVSDYTPSGGPVAAVGAGQTLQGGYRDLQGGVWSITAANVLNSTAQNNPWNTGNLLRPAGEATVDAKTTAYFTAASNGFVGTLGRWSNSGSASTGYAAVCDSGQVTVYRFQGGSFTSIGSGTYSGSNGTDYVCTLTVVQTNSTTTTITGTISDNTNSTVLANSGAITDTTAAMQNVAGSLGVFAQNLNVKRIVTYTDAAAAATAYTVSGPSSGGTGSASATFTATANGPLSSAVSVTPSATDGSFSPTTITLPAGSSPTATFTYTPASVGSKTLSFANTGGLTNPASQNYSATAPATTLLPNSAAFHFSPANWQCYGARACASGVTKPRTIYPGAYFCAAWTGSASPTATLLLSANSTGATLSYFLNGVLTDNVASTSGSIALSGLKASGLNQLMVVVRSVVDAASWGQTGANFNGLEVGGLQIDGASSAATAPAPCQPTGDTSVAYKGWGLVQGTSINVGFFADGGVSNYLHSNIWMLAQNLFAQGYDVGSIAYQGTGILAVSANGIPGLYAYTAGGYQAGSSRWNKTDAGISLLDSASHISAYGSTGSDPAFIFSNEGTNDANQGLTTYLQQATTGLLSVERAAAPAAKMGLLMDFPVDASTVSNAAAARAAITAGAGAFSDASTTFADFGSGFGNLIYANPAYRYDSFHPTESGNALIASKIGLMLQTMLGGVATPTPNRPFRGGFRFLVEPANDDFAPLKNAVGW